MAENQVEAEEVEVVLESPTSSDIPRFGSGATSEALDEEAEEDCAFVPATGASLPTSEATLPMRGTSTTMAKNKEEVSASEASQPDTIRPRTVRRSIGKSMLTMF